MVTEIILHKHQRDHAVTVVAPLMLCVGPWFTSLSVFGMISSLRTSKYRASFFTGADLDNDWYLDTYGFLPPAHGYHHPFARRLTGGLCSPVNTTPLHRPYLGHSL